jgi:hypothetical protein
MKRKFISLLSVLVVILIITLLILPSCGKPVEPGATAEFSNLHLKTNSLFMWDGDSYERVMLPTLPGAILSCKTGTASLLASTSNISVTHGMSSTPVRVLITPRGITGTVSSSTAANPAYVTLVGATVFYIKTAASTNTTVAYDWIAYTSDSQ